jgi:Initiator Replication protein.
MNEITKKNDDLAVSNIETGQLAKSRNFLFANFGRRMTATQNTLFSLALLHSKVEDGDYAYSTFTREDLEQFITDSKYSEGKKGRILKDMEAVGTNSMLLYDEKMMTDPANGKLTGVLIFASYSYDAGVYSFTFNTSKVLLDGRLSTPILEILKRDEVNPIVYNLDVFSKLTFGGQILYERILLATNEERRSLTFDLEDLRNLFGAVGSSMQRFDALNRKHLTPAVDSINEFAQIGVAFDTIRKSRKIVGVKLFWTLEKVNVPASQAQINTAHELFTELTLMEVDNKQLLEKLSNVQNMTIGEAKDVVAEAIALKKSILESKKETIEEEDALQEAINNKREQEAEKQAILSQNSGLTALADFLETSDTNEVVEETPLADYFKKHENLSKKNREVIMEISKSFEPAEALKMLELADDIKAWENGKTFGFIVAMLREWAENDVKTVSQAESFYKVNYNDIPEKAPTAKKPSKPKEGKSNVPKWSNPDYKNELDPKIIDELIAFHELYGTLDTPEAQEEIAQKRAEIEKKLAELEAKKWELLGKLDKA